MTLPPIAITLGDPKGIGSEVVHKALKDSELRKKAHFKIFGSPFDPKLSAKKAGEKSWQALKDAIFSLKKGECRALVTAPVSKEHLRLAGFPFPGHTEYLACEFKAKQTAMMLVSPEFKVVLATIHIPLKKVFTELTIQNIDEKICLTHHALKTHFGILKPKIAVCGLNPHAGEGGLFGREEQRIIIPAILKAQRKKILVSGPHPPDTIFYQARLGKYDAVICHYHDQGLIPLKTLSFDEGVNMTLGLPIVRTSPDHGCAFDIAGKGIANPTSMKAAIKLAVNLFFSNSAPQPYKQAKIIFNN